MTFAGLVVQTPPAAEPVTTAEAKLHLRVTDSDDDTYIGSLITAARQKLENENGLAFINQTWDLTLDAFPDLGDVIKFPIHPLSSVTSITYKDTDGTTQTWSSSMYVVDAGS